MRAAGGLLAPRCSSLLAPSRFAAEMASASAAAPPDAAADGAEHPGWRFFRAMGSPAYHVAPMVDQSELAFRMLCRRYGATCAYTRACPRCGYRTVACSVNPADKASFTGSFGKLVSRF